MNTPNNTTPRQPINTLSTLLYQHNAHTIHRNPHPTLTQPSSYPHLTLTFSTGKSLRNIYGPTETTIWASSFLVPRDVNRTLQFVNGRVITPCVIVSYHSISIHCLLSCHSIPIIPSLSSHLSFASHPLFTTLVTPTTIPVTPSLVYFIPLITSPLFLHPSYHISQECLWCLLVCPYVTCFFSLSIWIPSPNTLLHLLLIPPNVHN